MTKSGMYEQFRRIFGKEMPSGFFQSDFRIVRVDFYCRPGKTGKNKVSQSPLLFLSLALKKHSTLFPGVFEEKPLTTTPEEGFPRSYPLQHRS